MNYKKLFLTYLVLFTTSCFSQGWEPDPGFGGGQQDPATEPLALPIDGLEVPLLITGIIIAIVTSKKKQKKVIN